MKQNFLLRKKRGRARARRFWTLYLEKACAGDRTLVGAAKLNQISRMVSFMLQESGGGGMRGRSFFKSSDSTPSSYIEYNAKNALLRDVKGFFQMKKMRKRAFVTCRKSHDY